MCVVPGISLAAQFRTDYDVNYTLDAQNTGIATKVSFKIKITNLTTDLVIRKFSITFPKSFQIGNIKASDDFKEIIPEVTNSADGDHVIAVELSNPVAGINEENNIYLDFLQNNLFKVNGNVWEVILPTVENKDEGGNYTVTVELPPNSGKQIAISKPRPTNITLSEIKWVNPANKTIYAVFGKKQNYDLELRYHLQNPRITRVYTDIAFPPDTLYQRVFVNSISPKPDTVSIDEDGNYIGRYYLNPKEEKTIYFKGAVEIFAEARSEMRLPVKKLFEESKNHLLSPSTHWRIEPSRLPSVNANFTDIYNFTTKTLTYNYGRLNSNLTRLGANQALEYPDQAVCTEYSDVFIAIAREKGMFTREMQGYGFSNDQDLRPLSINADILHSWLEYYNEEKQVWIPIDPTWEDTSGIDYLTSFDLNHIVFAIHGKKSDYPYPAGSYKTEDTTKDINIIPTSNEYKERKSLSFEPSTLHIPTLNKNTYSFKITVQNTGNTFIWNTLLDAYSEKLKISPKSINIDRLAPLEKKELVFEYAPESLFANTKADITLSTSEGIVFRDAISVTTIYYSVLKYSIIAFAIALGLFVAIKLIKR